MDLRVLRYFLTVAREQSFTKAAEQLNITQPTLSRQLAALEEELGAKLFNRGGHQITLTNEGLLLKRRALEIVDLEDKIVSEFKGNNDSIEGKITIGCGEFLAVESLAKICKNYREKYPLVQFAIHTGTADNVLEMMNKGLVDIGLFLEPVNTQGLDYIRMPENDHWVVTMRPDDPLAGKEVITKNDLLDVPLILPERMNVQSELANWFGKDFGKLHIAFTSNLGTNAGVMALHGLGYPISIEGAARYWRNDLVVQKRLFPELKTSTVIAWRRNIPYSPAVNRFIEELNQEIEIKLKRNLYKTDSLNEGKSLSKNGSPVTFLIEKTDDDYSLFFFINRIKGKVIIDYHKTNAIACQYRIIYQSKDIRKIMKNRSK